MTDQQPLEHQPDHKISVTFVGINYVPEPTASLRMRRGFAPAWPKEVTRSEWSRGYRITRSGGYRPNTGARPRRALVRPATQSISMERGRPRLPLREWRLHTII